MHIARRIRPFFIEDLFAPEDIGYLNSPNTHERLLGYHGIDERSQYTNFNF